MITTGYCLRKLQEHVLFVNHSKGNVRFQLNHIQFFALIILSQRFYNVNCKFCSALYKKSVHKLCHILYSANNKLYNING